MAWFEKSFGTLYPLIYRHRSRSQAEPEAAFAVRVLDLRPGDPVLDLASGEGRHLVTLRRLGLRAFGADLSQSLVETAGEAGLPVVRADMRALPFRRCFRAVLSFFTSFGYFDSDGENLSVLDQIATCLEPGGRLLLDLPNRALLEESLVPHSEKEQEGYRIIEDRSLEGDRMVKRIQLKGGSGEQDFVESVRLFRPDEIRSGLLAAGLEPDRFYGAFDGSEFEASSGRMIVTATAGGES